MSTEPSNPWEGDPDLSGRVKGDIIGAGIDGHGNIIGKNIVIINEIRRYGLNLLPTNYFVERRSTQQDFENWKKGFSFTLESIKEHLELRRDNVIGTIKNTLESQHRLLLLGRSGTSKSTILMEIMNDYFNDGYTILYNYGDKDKQWYSDSKAHRGSVGVRKQSISCCR